MTDETPCHDFGRIRGALPNTVITCKQCGAVGVTYDGNTFYGSDEAFLASLDDDEDRS